MGGISKYIAQHTLTSDLNMSHVNARCIRLNVFFLLNLTFTLRTCFCCFVLNGLPRFHACFVEDASRLGCSNWIHCIAPGQRTYHANRNTLLEIDLLGFKRAIHQLYSTDLPSLDCVYFPIMKSYLRGTNRPLDHAWFMNVYRKKMRRHHNGIAHQGVYLKSMWHYYDVYRHSCDVGLRHSDVHGDM